MKSKIANGATTAAVNQGGNGGGGGPPNAANILSPTNQNSQFNKELPNIQARSIAGGIN